MSVKSQLEKAEKAMRHALIAALAEGEDEYLTELFNTLSSVSDLKKKVKKVNNTIRFSDNTAEYYKKLDDPTLDYSFEIVTKKNGKDLDVLDNVIQFPKLTD